MQTSEIYRLGIVLPLDEEAEECLRANEVDFSTHVRVLKIPNATLFDELWHMKLFDEINARCGTLIDEYEEEWADISVTPDILAVIDSMAGTTYEPAVVKFLAEFRAMVAEAHALSRPLLFVF